LSNESITNLVNNLRVAIGTCQRTLISDALDKVPPELRTVLPTVNTALALLTDIDNHESGGVNISLPPLPINPYARRTGRITWETQEGAASDIGIGEIQLGGGGRAADRGGCCCA